MGECPRQFDHAHNDLSMNLRAKQVKQEVIPFGTSHTMQLGKAANSDAFAARLREPCAEFGVRATGEEMNSEALEMRGAPGTIGALAAKSLGMNHDVCDPSSADRERLGITNVGDIELHAALDHWPREQFEARIAEHCKIREAYWLARLREADTWPVLFICGANHADSFA